MVDVKTKAELEAAMLSAAFGSEIHVAPGNYNGLSSRARRSTSTDRTTWITIRPKDYRNPPVFTNQIDISGTRDNNNGACGFIFEGLIIDGEDRPKSDFSLLQKTEEFPNGKRVGGLKAFSVEDCANIQISDCLVLFGRECVQIRRSQNIRVMYNTWRYWGMDPVRVFETNTDILIEGNASIESLIYTPEGGVAGGDSHPDAICQAVLNRTDNGPITRLKILKNYCKVTQHGTIDNTGTGKIASHAIFLANRIVRDKEKYGGDSTSSTVWNDDRKYIDLEIRDNYIECSDNHGASIEGARGVDITGNYMRRVDGVSDGNGRQPIVFFYGSEFYDVKVSNNVTTDVPGPDYGSGKTAADREKRFYADNWQDAPNGRITFTNDILNSTNGTSIKPVGWVEKVPSTLDGGKRPLVRSGNVGQWAVR